MFSSSPSGITMSQLFTAVYEVTSERQDHPTLRLNLIVNRQTDSVLGHAHLAFSDGESVGISVRGHYTEIGGERPLQAIVLAGLPAIFPGVEEVPSGFQMLMVLPTASRDGQVCYKMSFGTDRRRIVEIRDGVGRALLPEMVH
jgi:hypothetical protein